MANWVKAMSSECGGYAVSMFINLDYAQCINIVGHKDSDCTIQVWMNSDPERSCYVAFRGNFNEYEKWIIDHVSEHSGQFDEGSCST